MIIVPDASVILKWVLEKGEGEEVSKALELQNGFIAGELELQVPTLWQYEAMSSASSSPSWRVN
jgi:hypothetical protein